jgi:hypothetical protein
LEAARVVLLDGKVLRKMIEEDHEFGFQIMKKISMVMEDRLQATRVKLMEVYDIYPGPDQTRPIFPKTGLSAELCTRMNKLKPSYSDFPPGRSFPNTPLRYPLLFTFCGVKPASRWGKIR